MDELSAEKKFDFVLRLLVFACECNSSESFTTSIIAQIQKRSINFATL